MQSTYYFKSRTVSYSKVPYFISRVNPTSKIPFGIPSEYLNSEKRNKTEKYY